MRWRHVAGLVGAAALFALVCTSILGQPQGAIEVTGSVVSFDQAFGSVGTDITAQALQEAGIVVGDLVELHMSGHAIEIPVISDLFPQLPQSLPGVIVWGTAYIGGWYTNIAEEYDVALGDEIVIRLVEKAGYLEEIAAREVDHVERRDECSSDEEYANFRGISSGNIADGVLFRSSHPADGSVKSTYAHALMVQAGVQTIINVGASWNDPQQAFDNSDYYRARGDEGAILATNIGLAVTWPHFKTELGRVLRFMIEHEAPYLIHCSLGQDRAGITSAVLEALAGADLQDVIDDYALTFWNYYRIQLEHKLYPEVVEQISSKLREMNDGLEVTSENLQGAVEGYLIDEVGLSASEIDLLQARLSGGVVEDDSNEITKVGEEPASAPSGDSVANVASGMIRVLFDEAHDEINTISETRARVVSSAHPEWFLFDDMVESLSGGGYSVERGLSRFDGDPLEEHEVVILANPEAAFSEEELDSLLAFVEEGGGLFVIQGSHPSEDVGSNQIAELLGARFRSNALRSEHGDWDPESFRVDAVKSDHPIVQSLDTFQMNWGSSIVASQDWDVLLESRADTWQDLDDDRTQDANEPAGPLAVAVARQVARGHVVLVADNAFHEGIWLSNGTFFMNALDWLVEPATAYPSVSGSKGPYLLCSGEPDTMGNSEESYGGATGELDWSLAFTEPGVTARTIRQEIWNSGDRAVGLRFSEKPYDATLAFEGIQLRAASDTSVGVNLMIEVDPQGTASEDLPDTPAWLLAETPLGVGTEMATFRVPFSAFQLADVTGRRSEDPQSLLERLRGIYVALPPGHAGAATIEIESLALQRKFSPNAVQIDQFGDTQIQTEVEWISGSDFADTSEWESVEPVLRTLGRCVDWAHQQGGTLEVIPDPTGESRGLVGCVTIPPKAEQGAVIADSGPRIEQRWPNILVYRVYPGAYFPQFAPPCIASLDVYLDAELLSTAVWATSGTILLDVYDEVVDPAEPGAWVSSWGVSQNSSLQAKLWSASAGGDKAFLSLKYGVSSIEVAAPTADAPEFTPDEWHTISIVIWPDRMAELYQDGELVTSHVLDPRMVGGTTGGHPGLYIHDSVSRGEYAIRGTFLYGNYRIQCSSELDIHGILESQQRHE